MATALPFPAHRHPPVIGESEGSEGTAAAAGGGGGGGAATDVGVDVNPDGSLKVQVGDREDGAQFRVTPDGVEYVPTTDEHQAIAAVNRFVRDPLQPLRDEVYRNLPLTEVAQAKAAVNRFGRDPLAGVRDEINRHLPLNEVAQGKAALNRFVRDPTVGIRDEIKRSLPLNEWQELKSKLAPGARIWKPMLPGPLATLGKKASINIGGTEFNLEKLEGGGWTASVWGDGFGGAVTQN